MKKTIGILGGMGPLATKNFYEKVLEIFQIEEKAEQDEDYPAMILYSLPLEGFSEKGFEEPEYVKEQLVKACKRLESWGSDFIVIPCNTVHYFHKEMQSVVTCPVVDIVKETVLCLPSDVATVGLLTSESTRSLGLYKDAINKRGKTCIETNSEEQELINEIILRVMSGNNTNKDLQVIKSIASEMVERGAQVVVLGCTELPAVLKQEDFSSKLISSIDVLALATWKMYTSKSY